MVELTGLTDDESWEATAPPVLTITDERGTFTATVTVPAWGFVTMTVTEEGFERFHDLWPARNSASTRGARLVPLPTLVFPDVQSLTILTNNVCSDLPTIARAHSFPAVLNTRTAGTFDLVLTGLFAFGKTMVSLPGFSSGTAMWFQLGVPEGFFDGSDQPLVVPLDESSSLSFDGMVVAEPADEATEIRGVYNGTIGYCAAFDGSSPDTCGVPVVKCSPQSHQAVLRRR